MKKILCFVLTALLVVLVACKATIRGKAGDNVPLIGGSEVEISVDIGRGTVAVPPQGDLKEGDCIKVTFLDGKGKPIGSAEGEVGKETPAPEGTEDIEISPCDPKPDKKDDKSKSDSQVDQMVTDQHGIFLYRRLPFNMRDGRGHWIDYTVEAASHDEADAIAGQFSANLLSRPKQVEVYTFADVSVRQNGSVRFSILTQTKPHALTFDWNGMPLYTLHDARVQHVGSWYITSVIVPADLVNIPSGFANASNEAHYRIETSTRPQELSLALGVSQ